MDNYSKIILSLIAIALWGLLLRPIVAPEKLRASDSQDVNIAEIGGHSYPYWKDVPVEVKNTVQVQGSVNCR